MVSKAKRRCERGSDVLSRGFIDIEGKNLEGKKADRPDIGHNEEEYVAVASKPQNLEFLKFVPLVLNTHHVSHVSTNTVYNTVELHGFTQFSCSR